MQTITKQSVISFYLDWCNNWLTTGKMAEHYEMPKEDCEYLIELGRKYHNENFGPFFIGDKVDYRAPKGSPNYLRGGIVTGIDNENNRLFVDFPSHGPSSINADNLIKSN